MSIYILININRERERDLTSRRNKNPFGSFFHSRFNNVLYIFRGGHGRHVNGQQIIFGRVEHSETALCYGCFASPHRANNQGGKTIVY